MKWEHTQLSDFLRERGDRIGHEQANRLGLQRIRKIDFDGNIHLSESTATKTDMIRVRCGDLVISGIGATQGAIAVYEGALDVLATIHYSAYRFDRDQISAKFLKWFLKSAQFSDLLKEQASRRIRVELKAKHLLPLQVKIPNLPGQTKIANRMNTVDAEYSKLEHEIARQNALLARLKQAILQDAIQGKLTADWRAENPDAEPASRLLRRIKSEKDRLIAENKIRKQKPLPEITPEEIPFEIPENWEWCRSTFPTYLISDRNKKIPTSQILDEGKHPVVDQGKMPVRGFTDNDERLIELDCPIVLFGDHTRQIKYLDFNFVVGADGVKLLRPISVNPKYYYLALSSVRFEVKAYARHFKFLKEQFIPIPPLAEQTAIVKKVDSMMKICHDLGTEIERSRTEANALPQAALKEVFISHDPGVHQND